MYYQDTLKGHFEQPDVMLQYEIKSKLPTHGQKLYMYIILYSSKGIAI